MRVDVQSTKRAWRQTVWATGMAAIMFLGLIVYVWTQPEPDYEAIKFLTLMLLGLPVMLGVCYLIRRFIESLAS